MRINIQNEYNVTHMNLIEIATYVATGFVITSITMELAWSMRHKRCLPVESNTCKIMGTIGNRSIL
jgi:hypothetical protein